LKALYKMFLRAFRTSWLRSYSNGGGKLSHATDEGKINMVDVSAKPVSLRKATAMAKIYVGNHIYNLIKQNNLKKGDVLSTAQLAGIMAAKKTSDLIPLCHVINLSSVKLNVSLEEDYLKREKVKEGNLEEGETGKEGKGFSHVFVEASVQTWAQTGVEMEALTAASVASLTVYDMCKSVSHNIRIKDIALVSKTGGKSDYQSTL